MRPYLKDPAAIYAESFKAVRREARLGRFGPGMEGLAVRLIHACGMPEIADRIAFSAGAFDAGAAALAGGAPVLCDCEMVAAGVIRERLPAGNRGGGDAERPARPKDGGGDGDDALGGGGGSVGGARGGRGGGDRQRAHGAVPALGAAGRGLAAAGADPGVSGGVRGRGGGQGGTRRAAAGLRLCGAARAAGGLGAWPRRR